MKVIIVGGVAGGASCAARLRRLDEKAEILMVETRAVCFVRELRAALPCRGRDRKRIEPSGGVGTDVSRHVRDRCAHELRGDLHLDPKKKTVDLRNVKTGEVTTESYDKLVLSPGAASVHPPLPGIDLPGIFHVRTVPDARTIREWIERRHDVSGGDVQLLGHPDGQARAARGGGGRRVHRSRDGGEPDPSRVRRDPHPEARSRPVPAGPGDRGPRPGPYHKAWRAGCRQRRRGRIQAVGRRRDRGPDELRQNLSGGHRDPRDRRAAGHDAGQDGRPHDRRARRHPRGRAHAHERPGHLRRRRCHRGQGLRNR